MDPATGDLTIYTENLSDVGIYSLDINAILPNLQYDTSTIILTVIDNCASEVFTSNNPLGI